MPSFIKIKPNAMYKKFYAVLAQRYVMLTLKVILLFMDGHKSLVNLNLPNSKLVELRMKLLAKLPKELALQGVGVYQLLLKDKGFRVFCEHFVIAQYFYLPCYLTKRYLRRVTKQLVLTETNQTVVTAEWLQSGEDTHVILFMRYLIHYLGFQSPSYSRKNSRYLSTRALQIYYKKTFKFFTPGKLKVEFDYYVANSFFNECFELLNFLIDYNGVRDDSLFYHFQKSIKMQLPALALLKAKILISNEHIIDKLNIKLQMLVGKLLYSQYRKLSLAQTKKFVYPFINELKFGTNCDREIKGYAKTLVHPIILNLLRYLLKYHKKI